MRFTLTDLVRKTLENHAAEQRGMIERERQSNKELRSEIQRISGLLAKRNSEKTQDLEGKAEGSNERIEKHHDKNEKNNEKIERNQDKNDENNDKIEKNNGNHNEKSDKNDKNSQISINEVELPLECARANVLKSGLSLSQIKKVSFFPKKPHQQTFLKKSPSNAIPSQKIPTPSTRSPTPSVSSSRSTLKTFPLSNSFILRPPFLLLPEEQSLKLARFIVQRSKTHNFSEFGTIFSGLLEPLRVLGPGELKDLRSGFIKVIVLLDSR